MFRSFDHRQVWHTNRLSGSNCSLKASCINRSSILWQHLGLWLESFHISSAGGKEMDARMDWGKAAVFHFLQAFNFLFEQASLSLSSPIFFYFYNHYHHSCHCHHYQRCSSSGWCCHQFNKLRNVSFVCTINYTGRLYYFAQRNNRDQYYMCKNKSSTTVENNRYTQIM